jgi:branched-chain amino acid aminotransferase
MLNTDEPALTIQNRSFKYGDAVFETIKIRNGKIALFDYHAERLFAGLKLLQINSSTFNSTTLQNKILELSQRNDCINLGRIRLHAFRNDNNNAEYTIEANRIDDAVNLYNVKGWMIDLYPHAQKTCDEFANLKSANYLPYIMADLYAKENGLDECILLNVRNNISDASKANLFIIKKNEIYTPALSQGCIAGVMRKFIINMLQAIGTLIHETEVTEQMLLNADEVFLTNSIYGIRWVQKFKNTIYTNSQSMNIFNELQNQLLKN